MEGIVKTNEVLIVDDNESLLTALNRLLSAYFKERGIHNYKILTATSADAAVSILEKNTSIIIVISDIMMPGMDGLDFLRHITHNLRRGIQVIMITGQGNIGRAVDSFRNGAAEYIAKPFDISTIYEIMDRTIARLDAWAKIIKGAVA
ncbi:MAG: response regulator [Pseudomonadota bacterium]